LKEHRVSPNLIRLFENAGVDIVEKSLPKKSPSNIGVRGRYLLKPDIISILERTKPRRKGEIQLRGALRRVYLDAWV